MIKDTNQVKISQSPFFGLILRAVLLGWTGFACYNYNINPFFFGISIVAAISVFFLIGETVIIANEKTLIITHKKWIPVLSNSD